MANSPLRAILHDDSVFPNPSVFDPTRYLTPEGNLNEANADLSEPAFGFGRRICPGRHFAMDTLWIAMAQMLAAFSIEKAFNDSGKVVEPKEEYTPGILRSVASQLHISHMQLD